MDTILVVDDETEMTELIAMMLDEDELTVLTAGDGQEALTIALREHPQLVLTDIMMPRMNGVELCRRLQEDPDTRDTVVLLMTAAGQFEMGECSPVGLLRKPFDLDGLSETVRRHLGTASLSA
jgi:CheY-like chemotaxis protein